MFFKYRTKVAYVVVANLTGYFFYLHFRMFDKEFFGIPQLYQIQIGKRTYPKYVIENSAKILRGDIDERCKLIHRGLSI